MRSDLNVMTPPAPGEGLAHLAASPPGRNSPSLSADAPNLPLHLIEINQDSSSLSPKRIHNPFFFKSAELHPPMIIPKEYLPAHCRSPPSRLKRGPEKSASEILNSPFTPSSFTPSGEKRNTNVLIALWEGKLATSPELRDSIKSGTLPTGTASWSTHEIDRMGTDRSISGTHEHAFTPRGGEERLMTSKPNAGRPSYGSMGSCSIESHDLSANKNQCCCIIS